MKFHHVGIATHDIDRAVETFRAIHPTCVEISDIIYDPKQDASLKLVQLEGGVHFEFISGAAVSGLLKRKIDIYHTCFETDRFDETIALFQSQKCVPLGKAKPAILFGGRRVIFFKTTHGIVELLEACIS